MKTKLKILALLTLCLYSFQKAVSQETDKNVFFNDPTWSSLSPAALSPDGQWAVVTKKYNKNPRPNKTYFVNTTTKEKKDFSHFSNFYKSFLNKGIVVGNIKKDLAIFSLNQNDSLLIKEVAKFDTNAELNLLFSLKNNSEFTITKLSENLKKLKTELSLQAIDKYYLSPNSKTLVVVTKKKELIQINLKDFTSNKITDLKDNIKTLQWNINQDGFVIHIDNKLHVIDLNSNKIGVIDITEDKDIENLKLSFFLNNDLFVSYQFNSDKMIPESEYLDIWQGNSRQLLPSDFKTKYKKIYKAFVYKNKQDTITSLERKIDKDYLNIGIPGYLLSYNYFKDIDFDTYFPPIEYSLYDIDKQKNVTSLSMTSQSPFYPSIDGKHILYPVNRAKDKWEILNMKTLERHSFDIDNLNKGFSPIWSQDSKTIFYSYNSNLHSYNLENRKTINLTQFKKTDKVHIGRLVNKESIASYASYINTNKPFYFIATQKNNKTIYIFDKEKITPLYTTNTDLSLTPTANQTFSNDHNTVLFTIEDYNLPTKILNIQNKKVSTLIESDINKDLYKWRKRVDFTFTDKFNKSLNGYLFYPKNYDPKKKYPMVVQVYDLRLVSEPNEFSIPVHVTSNSGFNSSLLTENEYFVLSAQTYVTEEGPGISAVDCITNAVNKSLEIEPTIDKDNLGLIGHSFGGYKTGAISVLSDLFKASVPGAGAHDLIGGMMFRYSYFRRMPDWFIVESEQPNMGIKFSEDPEKYYNNSPILNAYKTKTAMLLFTGLQDDNVDWENTRKMFIALKREQKPVIALFYKNIIHGFLSSDPVENHDLSIRVLDWFDYHLKNKKNIPWIKKGLDYNKYSISTY
ncbi:alpha/beta hydrolase family protein [Myroides odoratimimus]|uniref:alpha/beta hydrolase family protein n=1 Tax=Myroides odoratimimus TaxID=76832 RepID=UPI0025757001|nr:prolyl oligopeptidase family serine peptidase [Myroides odoratimimus]MDM1521434.1 prolyl oligopeptidase family serine peptidase [Myroides odoratimimus]